MSLEHVNGHHTQNEQWLLDVYDRVRKIASQRNGAASPTLKQEIISVKQQLGHALDACYDGDLDAIEADDRCQSELEILEEMLRSGQSQTPPTRKRGDKRLKEGDSMRTGSSITYNANRK